MNRLMNLPISLCSRLANRPHHPITLFLFAFAMASSCCVLTPAAQAMEVFAFQRNEALGVNDDAQINPHDFTGPVEINTIGVPVKLPPNMMFMKSVQPAATRMQQRHLRSNPALEDDFRKLPDLTQPTTVYPAPPRL